MEAMARRCENCGAEAGDDARFCANCGAPLEAALAQRKFATMVFADLVGSTQLAAGSDPEQLRGRLAPFLDTAREAFEEYGGTIEKNIGDAVLAVFGVPIAHGDDPDRAVAGALALVERLKELDGSLAIRIGIEAGEILSVGGNGDLSVTGEAVNAAARLQQAAAPGETLVGERAAQATRLAKLERHDPVDAKGMPEPLTAWRAVGAAAVDSDAVPRLPLLGRDDELDLLRLVYRRAARERAPQLVIITGESGIGKSRLASELLQHVRNQPDAPRVLTGRNPPYGRGISFWALGEILREAACTDPDDPVDEVTDGLRCLLEELGAEDAEQTADALTVPLHGASTDGDGNIEEALKRAWRRFVALLTDERPLVLAIDDAHWADDGLLELLEEVAFGLPDARLVVLCTTRPELHERRPDFGRGMRNVTQVELRPLELRATTDLVRLMIPSGDDDLAARLAEASGGNPFFAEEVSRCMPAGDDQAIDLPDSIQAAIAARIDLLPEDERRTLQHAAVLGEAFLEDRLEDLLGRPPRAALDDLERRALLQEHLAKGPGRYVFRHQLIRDVAYAALPRRERAALHERAAAGIRAKAGERFVELAEIVAYHLAQAAELAPDAERSDAARAAAIEAAEIAIRRGAPARAQELYEHAATHAMDDKQRAHALKVAGEIALQRWRGDQGIELLRSAGEVAESAGLNGLAAACYGQTVEAVGRMGGISGDLPEPEIRDLLERGERLVPEDDVGTRALLTLDHAWIAWRFNRWEEVGEPAQRGLELARMTEDVGLLSSALDAVSADDWNHARYERCRDHARQRIELLEAAPTSPALDIERGDALHMMVESSMQVGEFEAAADWARQARERELRNGVVYSAWSRGVLPAFFLGRWDESLEMASTFREAWLAEERPPLSAMAATVAGAAAVYGYRGDEDAAREWFELAHSMVREENQTHGNRGGIKLLQADVALHYGQLDLAIERMQEPAGGFWWNTVYRATRAEAFIAAGHDGAEEALVAAEALVAEQPYARAIALRARGRLEDDPALIERSRDLFAEMGTPYQQARSGWLLGEPDRTSAGALFAELGVPPPAELPAALQAEAAS
jgi:class 3 adenylate cyclase